jgi:hypothetical protein
MKSLFIAALAAVCVAFAGCATSPAVAPSDTPAVQLTPEQIATQKVIVLATKVSKQCTVIQPFLLSLSAAQSQLSDQAITYVVTASKYTAQGCSAAVAYLASPSGTGTLSLAEVSTMVNSGVPALIKAVDASSTMNKDEKAAAEIAITAAQLAISTALANAQ